MKEMPIIPLFHYTMLYVSNPKVKGVVLSSLGSVDFKWAYVDQ
jgi:oligopeptide transport system substrate-binding protein